MTQKRTSDDSVRPGDHLDSYTVIGRRGRESVYTNLICIERGPDWIRFLMVDTPGATLLVEL